MQSGKPLRVFLTVGSQMPFDRLVSSVAAWAVDRPWVCVAGQIGQTRLQPDQLQPIQAHGQLAAQAYLHAFASAHLVVAHAGMGSILTALELNKPLVVMPRRGHLAETRNDHQFDTAQQLVCRPAAALTGASVWVAMNERELPTVLDRALGVLQECCAGTATPLGAAASETQATLIRSLRQLIMHGHVR